MGLHLPDSSSVYFWMLAVSISYVDSFLFEVKNSPPPIENGIMTLPLSLVVYINVCLNRMKKTEIFWESPFDDTRVTFR
jgi:hypothetical protein